LPDVKGFLDQVLTRRSLVIGVAGDIEPASLGELLDQAFGGLSDQAPPADLPPAPVPPPGLTVIPHPSQQSVVVFGHAGIAREDPDWYAATVVTQVLGGSTFTSRLGAEVREKRGLAYGIGASLSPYRAGSVLIGRTATRNDAVAETLKIIADEWQRMADYGPTQAELDEAKTYLIGSFPLSLDSTGAIASVLVQMQVYGLERDYWTTRAALYTAVDLAEAQRVAKRILHPQALLQVVVGMPEKLATASPAKISQ
jgi:zinc protease